MGDRPGSSLVSITESGETLRFFADSYLTTLAIALVVSYLGVFVVLKRIVFLGITLAQAAAAGIALVFFAQGYLTPGSAFSELLESYGPTFSALGVSTAAVAAFALPGEPKRLSRETLLGLGYAFFAGVSILLVWCSPKGVDELKNLLAGDVLFAREHMTLLLTGLGLVALLHGVFRKEFLLVSYDHDFASIHLNVKLYDLLLALSLGVAVSLALKVAGILLVFAFLAVPAASGLMVGRKLGHATAIALGVALSSSILGWTVATRVDLPVSPTISCFLVAHAALAAAVSRLHSRVLSWSYVGLVAILASLAVAGGFHVLRRPAGPSVARIEAAAVAAAGPRPEDMLQAFRAAGTPEDQQRTAEQLAKVEDQRVLDDFVKIALSRDEDAREIALAALEKSAARARALHALEPHLRAARADVRLHAAFGLVRFDDPRGIAVAVGTLRDPEAKNGTREEAIDLLLRLNPSGEAFRYDPFASDGANQEAVRSWEEWGRKTPTSRPR